MTINDITPEIAELLRSFVSNPHARQECPLQLRLMDSRVFMGSPNKVHLTRSGQRLLAAYDAQT